MKFSVTNVTIGKLDIRLPFHLTPLAVSILSVQSVPGMNASPSGDRFDVGDFTDNFKVQLRRGFARKRSTNQNPPFAN